LQRRAGWQPEPGPMLDADGSRVGEHAGAAGYTVGQRKGLGVALGEPRYVSRIDPLSNTITLARRQDLETRSFSVEKVTFVAGTSPDPDGFRADVRIRHRARPVPATIRPASDAEPARGGSWRIETDDPVWAVAPGQAAVFYSRDVVVGGGRIARS
jgi:tRNA-specific 2-thiouridylase